MNNSVNCWKAKSDDMPISSEASQEERSETIPEEGVHTEQCGSAEHPVKDEDIVRSPEKSDGSNARVYKVYYLVSRSTNWYYIGMTKGALNVRLNSHKAAARQGRKLPLYDCMRKYDDFIIVLRDDYLTHKEACARETALIKEARELGHKVLNLADGGEGGYVVPEEKRDAWIAKLSESRQGAKPFLGMQHTKETKAKCREASNKRWSTQTTYTDLANTILGMSFREAKRHFGISKTHYYRLKRQSTSD